MKATCAKPASPLAENAFSPNQSGKLGLYHISPSGNRHSPANPPAPRFSGSGGIRQHYTLQPSPAPPPKTGRQLFAFLDGHPPQNGIDRLSRLHLVAKNIQWAAFTIAASEDRDTAELVSVSLIAVLQCLNSLPKTIPHNFKNRVCMYANILQS